MSSEWWRAKKGFRSGWRVSKGTSIDNADCISVQAQLRPVISTDRTKPNLVGPIARPQFGCRVDASFSRHSRGRLDGEDDPASQNLEVGHYAKHGHRLKGPGIGAGTGGLGAQPMPTDLAAAVESYIRARNLSRGTRGEYSCTLTKWRRWGGGVPIEELTRKGIRAVNNQVY